MSDRVVFLLIYAFLYIGFPLLVYVVISNLDLDVYQQACDAQPLIPAAGKASTT